MVLYINFIKLIYNFLTVSAEVYRRLILAHIMFVYVFAAETVYKALLLTTVDGFKYSRELYNIINITLHGNKSFSLFFPMDQLFFPETGRSHTGRDLISIICFFQDISSLIVQASCLPVSFIC